MTPQQLLTVERALLAGVLSEDAWNLALMQLADLVGASYLAVMTHNNLTGLLHVTEPVKLSQRAVADYENEFQALNPVNSMETLPGDGETYLDWVALGHGFIKRSPFYQDFLRPHGLGHIMAHSVGALGPQNSFLSFHRQTGETAFDAEAVAAIAAVHGTLNLTLALRRQLRGLKQTQAWQRAALDALSFPIMVVNESGCVQQSNHAADTWLSQPACPLSSMGTGPDRQALLNIVRQAQGRSGEPPRVASVRLSFGAHQAGTTCVAIPLNEDGDTPVLRYGAALLMIWPARPHEPAQILLRQVFGLTLAEAQVAGLVAQGHTPREISVLRSVGESTVRSHIKAIFRKMHVHRQHDLTRLLTELALVDIDPA